MASEHSDVSSSFLPSTTDRSSVRKLYSRSPKLEVSHMCAKSSSVPSVLSCSVISIWYSKWSIGASLYKKVELIPSCILDCASSRNYWILQKDMGILASRSNTKGLGERELVDLRMHNSCLITCSKIWGNTNAKLPMQQVFEVLVPKGTDVSSFEVCVSSQGTLKLAGMRFTPSPAPGTMF